MSERFKIMEGSFGKKDKFGVTSTSDHVNEKKNEYWKEYWEKIYRVLGTSLQIDEKKDNM